MEQNLPSIGMEGWEVAFVHTYMDMSQDAIESGSAQGCVQLSKDSSIACIFVASTLKGLTKQVGRGMQLYFRRSQFGGDIFIDTQDPPRIATRPEINRPRPL